MLNYIASEDTGKLINRICTENNILILYQIHEIIDINKYLKETKINFNVVKYFIVELGSLSNSKEEIFEAIHGFSRLHTNIRIIILAQGVKDDDLLLNKFYNNGIYNIINSSNETEIEQQLMKSLSKMGISKSEVKKFERIEEEKRHNSILENFNITALIRKTKRKKIQEKDNCRSKSMCQEKGIYFYILLLEVINKIIKTIGFAIIFLLISIGVIVLFNSQLRFMLFQICGLK